MKKLIMVAGLLLILGSCYNDKYDKLYPVNTTVTCDTTTIGFAHDILPILNASCNVSGGCHDDAGMATSGYNFTTYDGIKAVATTAILVGDINWTPGNRYHNMPNNGVKLDQCNINKITRWVNQGALNN